MPNPASPPTLSSTYTKVLEEMKELLQFNFIGGLITSNDAGDAAHDVNIAAGEARDPTDVESLRLATEITKQIDAAWADGDDAGGIDAGAVAVDTLYAVWLIKCSVTGAVDALISTSFTAPTMPSDPEANVFDYKRLIGAVITDGAANIVAFTQSGDYFRYTGDVIADIADVTITADTFESGALSVPPNCLAHVYATLENLTTTSSLGGALYIRAKGAADAIVSTERFSTLRTASVFDATGVAGMVLVDASSEIEYAATEIDGAATVNIKSFGFTMLTRREP